MRTITIAGLSIFLFALGAGCTTRGDKEKNKDYDKPKAAKTEDKKDAK